MIRRLSLAAVLILLTGCEVSTDRWTERQAAVDPPELWRVEVVDADSPAVRICVDSLLRTGFSMPMPEAHGMACEPLGEPIKTEDGRLQRCRIGGRTLLVGTRTKGPANSFDVELRVTTLGPGPEASFVQTRRYTRQGHCPEGWKVGDQTDRFGRRSNTVWTPAWR